MKYCNPNQFDDFALPKTSLKVAKALAARSAVVPDPSSCSTLALCKGLDATQTPEYVDVAVEDGAKFCLCALNVMRQVCRAGGRVVYGWLLWEVPDMHVGSVFHAVWERPDGVLIDITPTEYDVSRVLFLPDSKRTWEECEHPNHIYIINPSVDIGIYRALLSLSGEVTIIVGQAKRKSCGIDRRKKRRIKKH